MIIAWYGISYFNPIIPQPHEVLQSVQRNFIAVYALLIATTAQYAFLALVATSLLVGILLVCITIFPRLQDILAPVVLLFKTTPIVALVPIYMTLFHGLEAIRITAACSVCFFPLLVGAYDGLRRTPNSMNLVADVYRASPLRTLYYIRSGYVLESMLSALKVSAPLSVVGAIVAEFIIGGRTVGLGSFIASNMGSDPGSIVSRHVAVVLSASLGLTVYSLAHMLHALYCKSSHISRS